MIPFDPCQPPYTSYVAGPDSQLFCNDKGVILATTYWQKHALPPSFTWLKEETIRAVEAGGGENLVVKDAPPNSSTAPLDAVAGTGIFGYEKRRVSNPPSKHMYDPSGAISGSSYTTLRGRNSLPNSNSASMILGNPAKKQKTEARKTIKKKVCFMIVLMLDQKL